MVTAFVKVENNFRPALELLFSFSVQAFLMMMIPFLTKPISLKGYRLWIAFRMLGRGMLKEETPCN